MEQALLVHESTEDPEVRRLVTLLDFFGVPTTHSSVTTFLDFIDPSDQTMKYSLFSSAATFQRLSKMLEHAPDGMRLWRAHVHSAFVYATADSVACASLARYLSRDDRALLVKIRDHTEWIVSDSLPEFCKSMSGIRIASIPNNETGLVFHESSSRPVSVIGSSCGDAFVKVPFQTVPVFLSTAGVIDIDTALALGTFDIRSSFLSAAPVVMYIKWALARACWQTPETSACLVIDDPLLTPRYGLLDFHLVRDLMLAHDFATNVALIPYNWRRSTASVVRLFKEDPERFSVSIHGCDHTSQEFGIQDSRRLVRRAREAAARMERHESRTGIRHSRIMVFPQGAFSEAAMHVLKHSGYTAVVNSDVISVDPQPRQLKVADYWNVAVMNYGDFPIFTRRYPSGGIPNFAFDILLGKPCIIVIHHGDCYNGCRPLMEFIHRLNALRVRLVWRNLGNLVRHSFRQRQLDSAITEIDMYGTELLLRNASNQRRRFRIRRHTADPSAIDEIYAGSEVVAWAIAAKEIAFETELAPGEDQTVRVAFAKFPESPDRGEGLRYRLIAMARRYGSEIRDSCLTRASFLAHHLTSQSVDDRPPGGSPQREN